MDSGHMSHDEFFAALGGLFEHRKTSDHGAIYLSQKRLISSRDGPQASESDPASDLDSKPQPILVRASNGQSKRDRPNKLKVSTVVQPGDLEAFYMRYADVCKAGMTALKPRDRSKKKAKAKKKKAAA